MGSRVIIGVVVNMAAGLGVGAGLCEYEGDEISNNQHRILICGTTSQLRYFWISAGRPVFSLSPIGCLGRRPC
jgi:hypothetical protein